MDAPSVVAIVVFVLVAVDVVVVDVVIVVVDVVVVVVGATLTSSSPAREAATALRLRDRSLISADTHAKRKVGIVNAPSTQDGMGRKHKTRWDGRGVRHRRS